MFGTELNGKDVWVTEANLNHRDACDCFVESAHYDADPEFGDRPLTPDELEQLSCADQLYEAWHEFMVDKAESRYDYERDEQALRKDER